MKKIIVPTLVSILTLVGAVSPAPAQTADGHKVVSPQEIKWGPAPTVLPPGAEAAVLLGDPGKDGLFALRLKFPKGYRIAPHTHPVLEVVTIISGTFRVGMGETADHEKAKVLPAGSFFALSPGTVHYASADEETVLQISTNGPWGLTYVNPKDDPRQQKSQ